MRRNHLQIRRDLKKLGFSGLILLFFRHLEGQLMIALSENDHRVAGDIHRFQLFTFIHRIGIVDIIKLIHGLLNLLFVVHVSRGKYLLAAACMPRSPLLHKFRKHTRAVALMPFRSHPRENLLSHTSARPVRNDLLCLKLSVHLCCMERHKLTLAHDCHVLHAMAAQLRERRRRLGISSLLADDQLPVSQIQSLF